MSGSSSTSIYHISSLPTRQIQVQITDFLEVKAESRKQPSEPWYGLADTVCFRSKNLYIPQYGSGPVRSSEKQLQSKVKRRASSPNLSYHQKELIDTQAGSSNLNDPLSQFPTIDNFPCPIIAMDDFRGCESSGESCESTSGSIKSKPKSKASRIKKVMSKARREDWK